MVSPRKTGVVIVQEINFRAWSKNWHRMEYSKDYKSLQSFFYEVEKTPGEYLLMRSSGYPDVLNCEIYEGDIIKRLTSHDPPVGIIIPIPVSFHNGVFVITDDSSLRQLNHFASSGIAIAGNIFQNPELCMQNKKAGINPADRIDSE